MKNTDPALLWDDDISVKTPVEGIKVYVHSNVQKGGAGAETWRSTTLTARRESFGAAEIGIAKNAWDNHKEEEDEEPTT